MQDFVKIANRSSYSAVTAGFAFLVKGADLFVEGSSSIAKEIKGSDYYHRTYHRSHGNLTSGNSSQCNGFYGAE